MGIRLTEGYQDGWFDPEWTWEIKPGEIKTLKILKVISSTQKDYCVLVRIRLQRENCAFNANVKINYQLSNAGQWRLEYSVSQGMDIVKTNKYTDCVSLAIVDDGWGSVNALQIRNNSGIELSCAGYFLAWGKWKKFATRIAPYSASTVGGTFGGGSVEDYKVEFVERLP